jgi:hypothetical protein
MQAAARSSHVSIRLARAPRVMKGALGALTGETAPPATRARAFLGRSASALAGASSGLSSQGCAHANPRWVRATPARRRLWGTGQLPAKCARSARSAASRGACQAEALASLPGLQMGLPLKVALKSRVSNFKLKVTRLAAQQNQTPTEGREWGRVAAARVSGLESIELSGSPKFCQDSQSCDAGPR